MGLIEVHSSMCLHVVDHTVTDICAHGFADSYNLAGKKKLKINMFKKSRETNEPVVFARTDRCVSASHPSGLYQSCSINPV